jgi:hypothetical protein
MDTTVMAVFRKSEPVTLSLLKADKQWLAGESARTGLPQSILVRKALAMYRSLVELQAKAPE